MAGLDLSVGNLPEVMQALAQALKKFEGAGSIAADKTLTNEQKVIKLKTAYDQRLERVRQSFKKLDVEQLKQAQEMYIKVTAELIKAGADTATALKEAAEHVKQTIGETVIDADGLLKEGIRVPVEAVFNQKNVLKGLGGMLKGQMAAVGSMISGPLLGAIGAVQLLKFLNDTRKEIYKVQKSIYDMQGMGGFPEVMGTKEASKQMGDIYKSLGDLVWQWGMLREQALEVTQTLVTQGVQIRDVFVTGMKTVQTVAAVSGSLGVSLQEGSNMVADYALYTGRSLKGIQDAFAALRDNAYSAGVSTQLFRQDVGDLTKQLAIYGVTTESVAENLANLTRKSTRSDKVALAFAKDIINLQQSMSRESKVWLAESMKGDISTNLNTQIKDMKAKAVAEGDRIIGINKKATELVKSGELKPGDKQTYIDEQTRTGNLFSQEDQARLDRLVAVMEKVNAGASMADIGPSMIELMDDSNLFAKGMVKLMGKNQVTIEDMKAKTTKAVKLAEQLGVNAESLPLLAEIAAAEISRDELAKQKSGLEAKIAADEAKLVTDLSDKERQAVEKGLAKNKAELARVTTLLADMTPEKQAATFAEILEQQRQQKLKTTPPEDLILDFFKTEFSNKLFPRLQSMTDSLLEMANLKGPSEALEGGRKTAAELRVSAGNYEKKAAESTATATTGLLPGQGNVKVSPEVQKAAGDRAKEYTKLANADKNMARIVAELTKQVGEKAGTDQGKSAQKALMGYDAKTGQKTFFGGDVVAPTRGLIAGGMTVGDQNISLQFTGGEMSEAQIKKAVESLKKAAEEQRKLTVKEFSEFRAKDDKTAENNANAK